MKKIFNKKTLIYFLAFTVPILIIWGYVGVREIISGGTFFKRGQAFLVADMISQYNQLYNYFHNVLAGNDSILYTFYNSLGSNMASTIGYYLSSPFNVLYGAVNKADIPIMTSIIYSLKIALCSLFMNIYISHKFGNKYTNLIFSLSYAFMGFTTVYHFNSMWLDVIYMTPLVIMGIYKLIGGKSLQYIITLSLSIIFNFYIAYMLCIFCVIYFIYELFIRYSIKDFKSYKKIILRFIISSLLAGGLSAFFLVPIIFGLKEMLRYHVNHYQLNFSFKGRLNFLTSSVLPKFYVGANMANSILGRIRPVVYVNLFCLMLSVFYFLNKKIKRKEKVLSLIIISFFMLSFLLPHLQLFWQLSFPNGYIDRYSFLFCFFIILLASKCFYNNDNIKIKWFIMFSIGYTLFAIYTLLDKKVLFYINKNGIIFSMIIMILYLIIYYLSAKKQKSKIIACILLLIVFVELVFNFSITFVTQASNLKQYYDQSYRFINKYGNEDHRVELHNYTNSQLDPFIFNYHSSMSALSTNDGKVHTFFHYNGGGQAYTYLNYDALSTPILPSIFGSKYIFSTQKTDVTSYKKIDSFVTKSLFTGNKKTNIKIYENVDALNIGFVINKYFDDKYKKLRGTGFDNINDFFKAMTGIDKDVMVQINREKLDDLEYKYHIDRDDKYLYFSANYDETVNASYYTQLYINNKFLVSLDSFNIGMYKFKNEYFNQDIIFSLDDDYRINYFNLYYFDEDVFKEGIKKLKNHQLENVILNKNMLTGEIDLDEDSLLFLSVPYDKGWNVYIDGKKTDYKSIADTFMGIEVPKGKHKITMKFYPRGILLGIIISLLSIIGIGILQRKKVYNDKKSKRKNSK